jgi:hypothetical protein
MWGYISTEASYQFNFNLGFSTTRSDVLVHLSQWQYWWWFWFTLVWSFYYLIVSRVVRYRVLKMRPKITTSYRPHGKWGDFLACIIPMIWCANILTNSNFILRLIEWQNESSLFTVRVRAKQWYWIYKFELKNFTDILTAPKNVGRDRWVVSTFGDLQVADDYLHILQLRSQNRWVKKYWNEILKQSGKVNQANIISPQEQFRMNYQNDEKNLKTFSRLANEFYNVNISSGNSLLESNNINNILYTNSRNSYLSLLKIKKTSINTQPASDQFNFISNKDISSSFFLNDLSSFKIKSTNNKNNNLLNNILLSSIENNNFNYTGRNFVDLVESSRWVRRSQGINKPFRLIKTPLLIDDRIYHKLQEDDSFNIFRTRFNLENNKVVHKNYSNNPYLVLKQKRYSRKSNIPSISKYYKDSDGIKTKRLRYSSKPVLVDNKIFEDNIYDPKIQYRLIKKNKVRNDVIPVTLARRILRTKKTLILPAHTNITLITNSYDIVHSWFIPGLGIKLDCVPGRSTHHTFYIDNVGFYYGQCAEICGRYHHHMPIRVCALPFEHFLTWWHTFGLPKLLFTVSQKRYESYYSFRKFVW